MLRSATRAASSASASSAASRTHSRTITPPTPPTGTKLPKLLFPLSVKDSISQWWRRKDLLSAEAALLECAQLNPETDASVSLIDVPVGDQVISELEVRGPQVGGRPNKHVVLLHGYGAARGFFYKNFGPLGSIPGYTLHALDMLGYGRSSRPTLSLEAPTRKAGVLAAESFFVDSLEAWRRAREVDSFVLVAHSLGAYVGCRYAVLHPQRVHRMLFVSPAGVQRAPDSIPAHELGEPASPMQSRVFSPPAWFKYGWSKSVSPFVAIRYAGPLGPLVASGWTSRRFKNVSQVERDRLHMYAYCIFNAKGSGEYTLFHLLGPGGTSYWPLAERVHELKCRSLWLYGDSDWMDAAGGHESVKRIRAAGGEAEVRIVEGAGHHLYLDNYRVFNELAVGFVRG